MSNLTITAYDLAQRFVGITEVDGPTSNATILSMLKLDNQWPSDDEVPWCSAFTNYIAWLLRLPRSKDLRARSWLFVGVPVDLSLARVGFDVAIFGRGPRPHPGPEVLEAQGHVGFFGGLAGGAVMTLGGNQGNTVRVSGYPVGDLLGIRRLLV